MRYLQIRAAGCRPDVVAPGNDVILWVELFSSEPVHVTVAFAVDGGVAIFDGQSRLAVDVSPFEGEKLVEIRAIVRSATGLSLEPKAYVVRVSVRNSVPPPAERAFIVGVTTSAGID